MKTVTRWAVRPSNFPLGAPGEPVGYVDAADHTEAQAKAEDHYGRAVVVEPARKHPEALNLPGQIGRSSKLRSMTQAEIDMARALGCIRALTTSRYRSTIRRLHAESFKPAPTISSELATILRTAVRSFGAQLPSSIVELAEGGIS